MTKVCSTCLDEKSTDFFYKLPTAKDGFDSKCKTCRTKYTSEYKKKKRADLKKYREEKGFVKGTMIPKVYPKIMEQPETIRKVVVAWMENPTATKNEIAMLTGLSNEDLNFACYHNPYLKAFRALAQKSVKNLIPLAVYGLKESLQSPNEKVKLTACLELLKSEKVLGAERIDVTLDDVRSRPIEDVRKLIQEAKLIPQPSISSENLIGTPND